MVIYDNEPVSFAVNARGQAVVVSRPQAGEDVGAYCFCLSISLLSSFPMHRLYHLHFCEVNELVIGFQQDIIN
jgi:hypothetical protein